VLGSAGEFPDLNEQERLDFFRFYAEYVNGRVELLAGTGCIRYADTLALSNAVYELGYTPMVISPYYFEMDQEKPFVYYDRLAKDVKGDLYLYNFPPRTGHSIAPETIRRHPELEHCRIASDALWVDRKWQYDGLRLRTHYEKIAGEIIDLLETGVNAMPRLARRLPVTREIVTGNTTDQGNQQETES